MFSVNAFLLRYKHKIDKCVHTTVIHINKYVSLNMVSWSGKDVWRVKSKTFALKNGEYFRSRTETFIPFDICYMSTIQQYVEYFLFGWRITINKHVSLEIKCYAKINIFFFSCRHGACICLCMRTLIHNNIEHLFLGWEWMPCHTIQSCRIANSIWIVYMRNWSISSLMNRRHVDNASASSMSSSLIF